MKIATKKRILDICMLFLLLVLAGFLPLESFIHHALEALDIPRFHRYIHIVLGVLLTLMICFHLYLNKSWIMRTLGNIRKGTQRINLRLVIALALFLLFVAILITGVLAIGDRGNWSSSWNNEWSGGGNSNASGSWRTDNSLNESGSLMDSRNERSGWGNSSLATFVHSRLALLCVLPLAFHIKDHWSFLLGRKKKAVRK